MSGEDEHREPEQGDELEPAAGQEVEQSHSTELERRRPAEIEMPGVSAEPYMGRFRFVLGALGGFAVAAIAIAVIIGVGGKPAPGPAWSAWKPHGGNGDKIQQIAHHIGPTYHLPDGNQLVAVNAGPLALQGAPVAITVRTPTRIDSVDGSNGVLYTLCGLGDKCSIDKGKPSNARGVLLRREALELALYTFRYVDKANIVVALLPPPPGQDPSRALFYRRSDLEPSLEQPLARTLPGPPPSVSAMNQPELANDVLRRTEPNEYAFKLNFGAGGGVELLLDQSPPQPATKKKSSSGR
ncbi:MAG TPA: hypothetical protein VF752_16485 [Thermoleophilaceae bacterium]